MHIVLDATAMVAVSRGNPLATHLIHRAHTEPGWHLYATTCALIEADRQHPGTAEHLAALPGITLLALDLPAALALAADTTWAHAHTRDAAAPTPQRPDGALVATADPYRWKGEPVRVITLTP
ncbi:hypothetical protein [Kitasatospora sp. NPDC088134]|uniref:hypothetical protein n=1 Tax=Kitasatospora sp. NPDC088134 TaxID=3364071 RepID=UPI00382C26A3